ncbi:MAG TPA: hypothetical protein VI259_10050 [Gemmatimonadaceae bacterium]
MAIVDSNSAVHYVGGPTAIWPRRLEPQQVCGVGPRGSDQPAKGVSRTLIQAPIEVIIGPGDVEAREIGSLSFVEPTSRDTTFVAHYLRVWRKTEMTWRVVFVCTSLVGANHS